MIPEDKKERKRKLHGRIEKERQLPELLDIRFDGCNSMVIQVFCFETHLQQLEDTLAQRNEDTMFRFECIAHEVYQVKVQWELRV